MEYFAGEKQMNLRLFFAIKPPEDIINDLACFIKNLDRNYWKPSKIEQLHITLAFIGQTPIESVDEITRVARKASEHIKPFKVELNDCDAFPNYKEPRVLYVKVRSPQLVELGNNLRAGLNEFVDKSRFKPHLTLGRSRKPAPGKVIRKIRGQWLVDGFHLFKSTLNESGAIHEQLEFFPLYKDSCP
jgi:2'-5' RNA ligase